LDKSYELFCLADPIFYDSPTREQGHADLALAARPLPSGWMRTELGDWLMNHPDRVSLPPQGWKIHASATLENAEEILAAVWDYCVPKNIPFKFIRSIDFLFLRNAKYADRGSSGKFVTIYPKDEAQAEVTLTQLGAILEGQSGPYILSDLRWGDPPL